MEINLRFGFPSATIILYGRTLLLPKVSNIEIIGVRSVNVANWPDLGSRVDRLVGLGSSFLQSFDLLPKPILSLKEIKFNNSSAIIIY